MRDETIGGFLGRLADRVPAPGGGACAALHAAQGAALVGMVGRYSDGPKYDAHRDLIDRVVAETDVLRERALELAERDAAAFTAVADAYRLPKDTPEAAGRRRAAISAALVGGAEPPAHVVAVAAAVLDCAHALLPAGNRNVITDVAAAAEAARAAAATARINIEVNLAGITDPQAREMFEVAAGAVDDLLMRADQITAAVRKGIAA